MNNNGQISLCTQNMMVKYKIKYHIQRKRNRDIIVN